MGRKKYKKREIKPDHIHHSWEVAKLINFVMEKGKKDLSRKIVYSALKIIEHKEKKNPLEVLKSAIKNAQPQWETRPRRFGGASYQVPVEVPPERAKRLALKWLVLGAREKKGKPTEEKLAEEILLSSKNQGWAVKKKEQVHKVAEANKAFAGLA